MDDQRLPEETDAAWLGYCCFRDLGIGRTMVAAYNEYRSRRDGVPNGVKKRVPSRFDDWAKVFDWAGRCRVLDLAAEQRQQELLQEQDDAAYKAQIEEFRQSQLMAGRSGLAIALEVKGALNRFLKTKPKITNWKDAGEAARLIKAVEESSSQQWAKALHIDQLLEDMAAKANG